MTFWKALEMMIEPTADMRMAATMLYQMYQALVQAGFTNAQAMSLIQAQMVAGVQNATTTLENEDDEK